MFRPASPRRQRGNDAAQSGSASRDLESAEGLRALLIRLHESGPGAWQHDRGGEADAVHRCQIPTPGARSTVLIRGRLLRLRSRSCSLHLDEEGSESVGEAVVTRAVQITCGVEIQAAGMLVSSGKVRHTSRIAGFHDAIRFADREHLADYHSAFAVKPADDDEDDPENADRARVATALSATSRAVCLNGLGCCARG